MEPVIINGVEISEQEINVESAHHREGSIAARRYHAAVALAIRELLRQRAVELGLLSPGAEVVDDTVDQLIEREVSVPTPEATVCRRYYSRNPERFRRDAEVDVRHILLAAHPADAEARERVRATAEDLIVALAQVPAPRTRLFSDLAARHSACPSSKDSGHLGWIGRDQTVPEFEDTVLRLPVGLAPRPLETRYGWHVVEVLDTRTGEVPPFSAVHELIARHLVAESKQRAIHQYLQLLAGRADVRNLDLAGVATPLVQ